MVVVLPLVDVLVTLEKMIIGQDHCLELAYQYQVDLLVLALMALVNKVIYGQRLC